MTDKLDLIELTSDIVSSHVTHNRVAVGDLPNLIQQVHNALRGLGTTQATSEEVKKTPAVSIKASLRPDFLVCLECGKKQKTLKRHLGRAHNLTPAEYRAEFGLPADYPMVAPTYSVRRSDMAKSIGLGRKPSSAEATVPSADTAQPAQQKVSSRKKAA